MLRACEYGATCRQTIVTTSWILLLASLLAAVAGWSGCRSGPEPGRLYAEGERLRLKYEKGAGLQALANFRDARTAWSQRKDLRQAARASQRLGMTYAQLGLLRQSLRGYQAALSLAQASPDPLLESDIRSDVGLAQSLAADREEALDEAQQQCEAAIEIARRVGGVREEAKALNCLGEVAYHHGDRARALGFFGQAEHLWERLGDARGQAETLLSRGGVYSDLGELDRAQVCLERSEHLWKSLGDARGTAITLIEMSKLYERRGDYQEALNGLFESLALVHAMGDALWEGVSLAGLGTVYLQMGDAEDALKNWERALPLYETAGLNSYSVDLLIALGETYLMSGDARKSLARFERALALGTESGNLLWQAYALRFIGAVHLYREDPTAAVTFFERSLAVQQHISDPRFQGQTLADLGAAVRLRGEFDRAKASFDSALALSRKTQDRAGEARGLAGLARVAMDLNDLASARNHIERALAVAESVRVEVGSRDLRALYFASVHGYHETHMEVLMRLARAHPKRGFAAAAFEASERAKARSMLDGLAEAGVDLRKGLDPALLQREQALRQEFDAWAVRQRQALDGLSSPALAKRLADEYRDLETRHGEFEGEIRRKSPRYAALARPQPLTLRQVQQQVLDEDTLLLEYALGDDRSYLWAVSKAGYTVHELPSRTELTTAAQRLYARLTARLTLTGTLQERRRQAEESDQLYWQQATQLSNVLLGPAATALSGKRILVVADGALQVVPFAALPRPGGGVDPVPLVAEHEVVSLPSASILAVLRRETAGRAVPAGTVAVLADPVFEEDDPRLRAALRASGTPPPPPSPGQAAPPAGLRLSRLGATRQEADGIIAAAGAGASMKRLGFEASRAAVMGPELSRYRIVHFATHGVFHDDSPGMSGIMLSMFDGRGRPQDGFLRLHDIYGLSLPADLVVLSACNTALGRQLRGEGLVGTVRGFMYAGAKRVVASLWKVDDEATGEMMRRFYGGMFEGRLSAAAALREAQVGMWKQSRWKAPFYWAAFSLQGESRP